MNIFSVYHRNEQQLQAIASFLNSSTDVKELAQNDSALYYDETMLSVTFETEMSFDEFEKVLDEAGHKDYIVCVEDNWFCD